jgi:hypothetical protein
VPLPVTPGERVAIAREVAERIGNRQGQRTDHPNEPTETPQPDPAQFVANWPQIEPGEKTRDAASKAAGFASTHEYRRAAKVVDQGIPELVEAMDAKAVTVASGRTRRTSGQPSRS